MAMMGFGQRASRACDEQDQVWCAFAEPSIPSSCDQFRVGVMSGCQLKCEWRAAKEVLLASSGFRARASIRAMEIHEINTDGRQPGLR